MKRAIAVLPLLIFSFACAAPKQAVPVNLYEGDKAAVGLQPVPAGKIPKGYSVFVTSVLSSKGSYQPEGGVSKMWLSRKGNHEFFKVAQSKGASFKQLPTGSPGINACDEYYVEGRVQVIDAMGQFLDPQTGKSYSEPIHELIIHNFFDASCIKY